MLPHISVCGTGEAIERQAVKCFDIHFFIFLLKLISVKSDIENKRTQHHSSHLKKDDKMASYRAEAKCSAEIVPFFLNNKDYVGFFLKTDPKEHNCMTFILRKKDFNSQTEFMKNLAIIYDSLDR
jgi:hypothetical protein